MIFDIYFTVFIRREKKSVDFILKSAKAFFFLLRILFDCEFIARFKN